MISKVETCTIDEFVEEYPEMKGLQAEEQDFSRSSVNPSELEILQDYFSGICVDLTLYMQVFSEEKSIDQLNSFNSFVFKQFEKALLQKICLKIATLMDPARTCGKSGMNKNLSLERFIEQTGSEILQMKYEKLKKFYESSGIKLWRNKILAHADLEVLSGRKKLNICFDRADVDNFVVDMQDFIDFVIDPRTSTDHKVVLPRDRDGYAFIDKIRACNGL